MSPIRFEEEEERRQTEALADRMVKAVAVDHAFVGKTIDRVVHDQRPGLGGDDLYIKFSDGTSIMIKSALIEFNNSFSRSMIEENERQRQNEPVPIDPMRAEGDRLMRGSSTDPAEIPTVAESAAGLEEETNWRGVYPGMCIDPDLCRGKSHCPRERSCCE